MGANARAACCELRCPEVGLQLAADQGGRLMVVGSDCPTHHSGGWGNMALRGTARAHATCHGGDGDCRLYTPRCITGGLRYMAYASSPPRRCSPACSTHLFASTPPLPICVNSRVLNSCYFHFQRQRSLLRLLAHQATHRTTRPKHKHNTTTADPIRPVSALPAKISSPGCSLRWHVLAGSDLTQCS